MNNENHSETRDLREFRSSLQQRHLLTYFEDQVERTPESIAISDEDHSLSYQTLQTHAFMLAKQLQTQGSPNRGTFTLFGTTNITYLIAVLAVLQAGGELLLLEPTDTPLHIAQILEKSNSPLILTSQRYATRLQQILAELPIYLRARIFICDDPEPVDCLPCSTLELESPSRPGTEEASQERQINQQKMLYYVHMTIQQLQLSAEDCIAEIAQRTEAPASLYLATLFVGGRIEVIPENLPSDPILFIEYLMYRNVSILRGPSELLPAEEEFHFYTEQYLLNRRLRKIIPSVQALSPSFGLHWSDASSYPITQSDVRTAMPSFAQERQWVLNQLEPSNPLYNISILLPLPKGVNAFFLERSLQIIVERHATLRTTFALHDGTLMQIIAPSPTAALLRLPIVPLPENEQEVLHHIQKEAGYPFDLASGPLMRAILFLPEDQDALLFFNIHHSIFDGWSITILMRELALCYQAHISSTKINLPPLPLEYADFSIWQRQWLQKREAEVHMDYWREQLDQAPDISQFPMDYPRPTSQTYQGANLFKRFDEELLAGLQKVCQRESATLFMVLLAAFQTLLFRYTHQEDLLIGTPIANRTHVETEPLIGFFVNTLPLRIKLNNELTFEQLLRQVRKVASEAYAHQDIPFDKMLEALKIQRNLHISPLFQILFVLQNTPLSKVYEIEGKPLLPRVLPGDRAIFELVIAFSLEDAQTLVLHVQYNTALFTEQTIQQIVQHYQIILEAVVKNPATLLNALPLLGVEEQLHMLRNRYNTARAYPRQPACVHELFELCVERNPQSIALAEGANVLTYDRLNSRANQLAHYLRTQGIGAENVVGICLGHSFAMVIGLLAILKAGGAYMPIDIYQPHERLVQSIQQARIDLLLTSSRNKDALPQDICPLVVIERIEDQLVLSPENNPRSFTIADNLCYIVHTSGSTGMPKGIAMTHRPLMNLLYWHQELAGDTRCMNTVQYASPIFDPLFLEVFLTFLQGGTLKLLSGEIRSDPERLLLYMHRENIERIYIPFAALQQLALVARQVETAPLALREIMSGGEQLYTTQELRWWLRQMPLCRLWNTYGPSEAHEVTTLQLAADPDTWPPLPSIGYANANAQIYILDEQLRPVPSLIEGDLYVGGVCLSRGYVNQPDITAEHFIPHPFSSTGERLYRTGDRARYLSDNRLDFLGRQDTQVKIAGYRVELREIEVVLLRHPLVQNCVVSVIGERERMSILAYIIPNQTLSDLPEQLHTYLSNYLPAYMCPASYVPVKTFPMGATGKVDRRALNALSHSASAFRINQEKIQPQNELERSLAEIWCDVLGIEDIGIYENFFALGGHSLLAIRVILRVRESISQHISLRALFEHPTIARLAEFIMAQEIAEADDEILTRLLRDLDNT